MYKLTESTTIIRLADNAFIPADPANTDYAEYLKWLAEGNTPEPFPVPTPEEVLQQKRNTAQLSRAAFKLALLAGGYLDAIEAAYPTWPREVQIMWDDSLYFERMHPSLLQLAAAMGYSEAEVDALFGLVDDGPG
jgi:hypothetical protein